MANISSLYQYGMANIMSPSYINQSNNISQSGNNIASGQISGIMNSDGDSFQMSSPMMMGFMSYNQNGAAVTNGTSGVGQDIMSFIQKLKSGTATDADMTTLQTELQSQGTNQDAAQSQTANGTASNSASSIGQDIMSFIQKLKSGTATDADMTTLQTELQSQSTNQDAAQSQTVNGTASNGASSIGQDIMSFIQQLKNGTATDADMTTLQTELQSQSTNQDAAQSQTANSQTGSNSNIQTDLQNFINSIKNGTATDADLQQIQTELQQSGGTQGMTAQGQDGHGHHHHHGGGIDSNSDSNSDLVNFLNEIQNGTATDADLQSIETELSQSNNNQSSTTSDQTAQNSTTNSQNAAGSIGSELVSFLESVKNGTVNSQEMQQMQTELNQIQI